MRPRLVCAKLRDAFVADLSAAWRFFRANYPDHTPYAFLLYGVEDIPRLGPQVLTEQALAQVAQRYVDNGTYDSIAEARKGLRFSVADSPLFRVFYDQLPTVDALFEPHAERLGETRGYKVLAEAAMWAFKELDAQGLFGKGRRRERLLLLIVTDDCEFDWTEPSARRLNAKTAFKRFKEATKRGPYRSTHVLAVSPDGRRIFAVGSRKNPRGKPGGRNESISEVVCYDVVGKRVRRRWHFDFPGWGDSGRAICCAPDGKSFVVLRCRYNRKQGARAILMRFRPGSKRPVKVARILGAPVRFSMSPDGSRLAIAMHEDEDALVVVDDHFKVVYRRKLPITPSGVLFLRSGELLVGGDKQILRIDAATGRTKRVIRHPGVHMSVDREERFLAVSRWTFDIGLRRDRPVGLSMFRLPSLQLDRAYKTPGYQFVRPLISPDGKLLGVESDKLKGYGSWLIVFDTATGDRIAVHRCDRGTAFFPDSRTVALGKSCSGCQPVDLWTIPGIL